MRLSSIGKILAQISSIVDKNHTMFLPRNRHAKMEGKRRHQSDAPGNLFRASSNKILPAKLSIVEVLSAFNRRRRDNTLSNVDYTQISIEFLKAVENEYQILALTDTVLIEAQRLLENYPLRAGDAIQLASALLANTQLLSAGLSALTFLASDARLLRAAANEGLLTDDPQNH